MLGAMKREGERTERDVVLTTEEAAAYLRMSLATLYRHVREGRVPCFKVGNRWRFKRSVLDQWMERISEVSAGVGVRTLNAEETVKKGDEKSRVSGELGLGGIFKGLGSLIELAEKLAREAPSELKREGRIGPVGEKGLTAVYGLSVRVGGEGRPNFEVFGNVREAEGKGPMVDEVREPLVDVFDEGDLLVVVAEMPGVNEEDISHEVHEDVLRLSGETGDRKYHKELVLPAAVDETKVSRSCRNGIVELKLWKAKPA